MNELYWMDCTPLQDDARLRSVLPLLDDTRRQRVLRLQNPEKKAQCAAAGLMLTRLLGKNGTPPPLFHGSRGKPYLYGRDDCFFSLSHSGGYVFCALSDKEIGLDAQRIIAHNPAIAERHFSSREQEWLDVQGDKAHAFTQVWTMKEAYLKYTGFGMVLPMSSFTVPLPPVDGRDAPNACGWGLGQLEDVLLSLCGDAVEALPTPTPLSL